MPADLTLSTWIGILLVSTTLYAEPCKIKTTEEILAAQPTLESYINQAMLATNTPAVSIAVISDGQENQRRLIPQSSGCEALPGLVALSEQNHTQDDTRSYLRNVECFW